MEALGTLRCSDVPMKRPEKSLPALQLSQTPPPRGCNLTPAEVLARRRHGSAGKISQLRKTSEMRADGADLAANCGLLSFGASSHLSACVCLETSGVSHSVTAGEAWRMGRRCALLMSVPRQKLDSGVFDVFLLPQVKREPHTAVEHRLNNITNLLSCFCSRSPLMMQHHFPPLPPYCSVRICC